MIDLLRAVGTGLAVSAVGAAIWIFLKSNFEIFHTREGTAFVAWHISAGFVGLYLLGWLLFGRDHASAIVDVIVEMIIEPPLSLIFRVLEWGGLTDK